MWGEPWIYHFQWTSCSGTSSLCLKVPHNKQIQLHGSDDGRGGKFRLKLSRVPLNTPQRLLATDGRSVAEKIKPPRPVSRQPAILSSTSRLPDLTNDVLGNDAEDSDNSNFKSSKLKWFITIGLILGLVGVVLIKTTRKKSSESTSTSHNGPHQEESVTQKY